MIGVCTDITVQKDAELQQEKLLQRLERANGELKSFAYVVSHDLKAPLRGVKVLADWIRSDYADKLDEEGKNQMDLLVTRVDRMHNLIDGILQYSKIGRIEDNINQVNTGKIVTDIIDMISPPENIRIIIENELPVIECESTRIIQLFQNRLDIGVTALPQGDGKGCYHFHVHDHHARR